MVWKEVEESSWVTKADLTARAEDLPSRMLGSKGRNHQAQLHGLSVTQGTELSTCIPSARSSSTKLHKSMTKYRLEAIGEVFQQATE